MAQLDPSVPLEEMPPELMAEELDDGGVTFTFGRELPAEPEFDSNLAEYMDESDLISLSGDLIDAYKSDERSREEWLKVYINGLDLLGLKPAKKTEPWNGACGVFHPMLTDAVVRFQANTIQEIFPAAGPVKASVVGTLTDDKTKQANRVMGYMNYVTTKKMVEYRSETEKLLFSLPIAGSAFRKVYFDKNLGRSVSMYVPAQDYCVNFGASDLSTAERGTHIMRKSENDVRKSQVSGFYRDIDLGEPVAEQSKVQSKINELTGTKADTESDNGLCLLEMNVEVDLVGFEDEINGETTGIALPYVITLDKTSEKVLSIYRNWKKEDEKKVKRDHVVHYEYLPGLGFYGFGLVHMIGGLSESATSILRQLIDSGTLANLPGGFKTRGLKVKGDDTPIKPGEWRDVDVIGGNIQQNLMAMPYKEPSAVLYQLLGDLVAEGRRFASAADTKVSDMNGEAPVGTTLALLEKEMKVMSAVQARIHAAMGKELVILAEIIKDFGPEEYPYEVEGNQSLKQDFDDRVDIVPVSDPNSGTMAMRIMRWQAVLQLSSSAPQVYDIKKLHRKMIDVLGVEQANELVPTDDDMKPTDPITETQNLLAGKPVKAFMYQDHEAHIQAHMSAAENPEMQKLMAQHPNVQGVIAAGAAHLAEHLGFAFRRKIEMELGAELPHPDEPLPEDIELRLSRLVAPAAAQLTGKAQKMAKAEEDAKKQQDPIIQMQQEELKQKGEKIKSDAKIGMARIMADIADEMEKNKIAREKMQNETKLKGAELMVDAAGDQMQSEIKAEDRMSKEQTEGYRMGLQFAQQLMMKDKQRGDS